MMHGRRGMTPRRTCLIVVWSALAGVAVAPPAAHAATAGTVIIKNYGTDEAAVSASAGAGRIAWLRRPRFGAASVGRLAAGRPVAVPIARPRELRWLRVGPGVGGSPELTYARCVGKRCEVDRADLDGTHERRIVRDTRDAWVFGSSLLAPLASGWGISRMGFGGRPQPLLMPPKGRAWAFNGNAVAAVETEYDGDVTILRLIIASASVKRRVLLHRSFGMSSGFTLTVVGLTTTHAYVLELEDSEFGSGGQLWQVDLRDGRPQTASLPAGTVAATAPAGDKAAVSRCKDNEDGDHVSCQLELRRLTWRSPPR